MKNSLIFLIVLFACFTSKAGIVIVNNTNDNGNGSLREAVLIANSGDTIRFNPNLISGGNDSIVLTSGNISFNKSLTIVGLMTTSDTLFISGNNSSRIFSITGGTTVLDKMAIVNGRSSDRGAGIYSNCLNFTLKNSVVIKNLTSSSFTTYGAGIYLDGNTTIINSTISQNSAINTGTSSCYGGAIYANKNLTILNSTISNNKALGGGSSSSSGGGIYFSFGSLGIINNTLINENSASTGGGICSKTNSSLTVTNSLIEKNTASGKGGGIYTSGNLTLVKSIIKENTNIDSTSLTYKGGGGIFAEYTALVLDSSLVIGNIHTSNKHSTQGGGIFCSRTSLSILNSTISNNSSNCYITKSYGGGIYAELSSSPVIIMNSNIDSNSSKTYDSYSYGGGIYSTSPVIINNSRVKGNKSFSTHYFQTVNATQSSGGGIYVSNIMNIDSSVITENTVVSLKDGSVYGGGIYSLDTLIVANSIISSNFSSSLSWGIGAGVYTKGFTEFNNCIITENSNSTSVNSSGAGIYGEITTPSNRGILFINNSIISNNSNFSSDSTTYSDSKGAGIYTTMVLKMTNSVVKGNVNKGFFTSGAGIVISSSANNDSNVFENTTISNNSNFSLLTFFYSYPNFKIEARGAGIYVYSEGGLSLRNSTITGNLNSAQGNGDPTHSSGAGIYAFNTPLNITNCTLAENSNSASNTFGSGIYSNRTSTIGSSIIALNTGGINIDGVLQTNGYNIFSNSPNGYNNTDQVNVTSGDLNLGSLQFNGSTTLTMIPKLGSIAINEGDPIDVTNAQNGTIKGGRRDVGAAESGGCPNFGLFETFCPGGSYVFNGKVLNTSGVYYDTIQITGGCDSVIRLELYESIPTPSVSITANPGNNITIGASVTFTANIYNGGNAPSYQWKLNGNNVGNNNSTYTSNNLNNNDIVTCELTSSLSCANPNLVISDTIKMIVSQLLTNDDPCNATSINVSNSCNFTIFDNSNATNSPGINDHSCQSASSNDVWFSFVAPFSGDVIIKTQELGLKDAVMSLYAGTCSNLTEIDCNDDELDLMPQIHNIFLTAGTNYYIRLSGYSGESGTFGICVKDSAQTTEVIDYEINNANLYPNPANNKITLDIENVKNNTSLTIIDIAGKELYRLNNISDNKTTIPVSNLNNGMYFVKITSQNTQQTLPFIKE